MIQSTNQSADQLLAEYLQTRSRDTRDRLVEHHLPWIMDFAESTAKRMRLTDPENASAECALLFAVKILPSFDGRGSLAAYSRICIVRKLTDSLRQQRRQKEIVGLADNRDGGYWLDSIPAPPAKPPRGIDWQRMATGLTAMQETILRLRFRDYATVKEAADRLGMSCSGVKRVTRGAIDAARVTWGSETPDELRNQN